MTLDGDVPPRHKQTFGFRQGTGLVDLRFRRRQEIVDWWLPEIVDEVLWSHEIIDGISRANLDRTALRQLVLDARQEILAPADALLERVVNMTVRVSIGAFFGMPQRNRVRGAWSVLVGIVLMVGGIALPAVSWASSTWWARGLGILAALVLGTRGALTFVGGTTLYNRVSTGVSVEAAWALAMWWETCRVECVLPFVRRVIDGHIEPTNRFGLGVTASAPGLRGTNESSYVVRTGSVEAFMTTAKRLPTGAIGLAGPRGVGKTSLIEYFAGRDARYGALKVTVSAPVQYEPRDFVLHLFATLCAAVLRVRTAPRGWR